MCSIVNIDSFENIDLNDVNSNTGQSQFFKNIKVLCKFNYKIHLVSYLHLQIINNIMLFIVIVGSFISGLFDTINHNEEPKKNSKLIFGCIEIFFAILITFYKQSKIAELQRDHYHFSNSYRILLNKINTDLFLMNNQKSIYINNIECIRDITDQFNNLINNAPIIPYLILRRYHIKDTDLNYDRIQGNISTEYNDVLQTNTNNLNNNSTNNTVNTNNNTYNNTDNNKSRVRISNNIEVLSKINENINETKIRSPKKKTKNSQLNRKFSIQDLHSINQNDIDNYNSFINKINIKHEKKYINTKMMNDDTNIFNNIKDM